MTVRRLAAAVLLVAAAGSTGSLPASGRATARRYPARLLVYAQEWSLWPSRTSLPAGKVIVQLANRGQDAHDLAIRAVNRRGAIKGAAQLLATVRSGALGQASWHLRPGRYMLYCTLPGHSRKGMHTVLIVQ